ncbi:2-dehydropantoate 2-reductase [Sulfurimonas sp. HSL-1716]|uniref:ketopantoate reductase family protein n=1 Tax=Hydrocurvibacter sulfurireducens TaxID=3131937 RepID=UPI0031F7C783
MRVLVYGLGGVGGYIAAYLCRTENEIVGVARGEHLKAIQQRGLRVVEDDREFRTTNIEAVEEKELGGYFDMVLFCVKSYDLEDAVLACKPFIDENSIVLSLANGVEHGGTLRRLLHAKVLDGCVYILSHIKAPGEIKKSGDVFALIFAGEGSELLADMCEEAGLRYKVPQNVKEAIWKKYIFISTFAMLTSYYDESIRSVYENHYDKALSVLKEIALIAKAKDIDIEEEIAKALHTASKLPKNASTSMHKDIKATRRDELETLCGYLVREADALHINIPDIQRYYDELLKVHH